RPSGTPPGAPQATAPDGDSQLRSHEFLAPSTPGAACAPFSPKTALLASISQSSTGTRPSLFAGRSVFAVRAQTKLAPGLAPRDYLPLPPGSRQKEKTTHE